MTKQMNDFRPLPPERGAAGTVWAALVSYAALLVAFWMAARQFKIETSIRGHFPSAFAGFALLLAPYWFFGFGLADWLRRVYFPQASAGKRDANLGHRPNAGNSEHRRSPLPVSSPPLPVIRRIVAPGVLVIPYLLFAVPRGELRLIYALLFFALPMAMAAVFELAPPGEGLSWQDVVVLAAVGLPVEFRWLEGAWPYRGLGAMPKLLLVDAALYAFLVVRRLPDMGYDFRPRWRDLAIGLREWLFFAPLAVALGIAIHFIRPRAYAPDRWALAAGWLVTFVFVALPEELYFRGLLQNLIEKRVTLKQANTGVEGGTRKARMVALLIAAPIFGLSHFNKPLPFNWRYVLLATIAGVFYGRAWLDRRRLLASGITHAAVDVVWSVWFR